MKRFSETATREALKNGAAIRFYDYFSLNAGYRIMVDGEIAGYITFDLWLKLNRDETIVRSTRGFDYEEYTAAPAEESPRDEILKDINGDPVKVADIDTDRHLFTDFQKGDCGTLRNDTWTFYADVTCHSKRGNRYTFTSDTYGHRFIVDLDQEYVQVRR
ncbi:MAG: hypothetical protein J6S14_11845 [Clostridia bacterium]|nr:hypothetical protein [Clostridia bacterium]